MPNHSGIPAVTSRLVAKQYREDYRKEHGTNPPDTKELFAYMKARMDSLTEKDHAALGVRLAEGDVAHFRLFSRTPMERIEADERLRDAKRRYEKTPGKETPRILSLREKVCELLDKDKTKVWKVRDLAEALGHPAIHVGVVVSFLRKEKDKKWNIQ